MNELTHNDIITKMQSGQLVPYLGPGALTKVTHKEQGTAIPADSDSLILAMNGGQPMAPRLMYEFPRAAMHLENRKGRSFIERFLSELYTDPAWTQSELHQWLASLNLPYIIDSNRDAQFVSLLENKPHVLIVGVARIAAHPYRFDIYEYADGEYKLIEPEQIDFSLPVLFKPLGCPYPKASYIASDADFVDYITELMGGFAIPAPLKTHRADKQYLFFGMRFTRDTERMVMSDIIYAANQDVAGYAMIESPTDKEKRFLAKKNVQIIDQDCIAWFNELKNSEALAD